MRTLTMGQLNYGRKAVLLLLVVAAFCMVFLMTAKPASAQTLTGEYNLDNNMTDVETLPDNLAATTFYLYKVGHFENGRLVLDEAYADIPVDIPLNYKRSDFDNDDDWARAWLDSANTLADYVKESTLARTIDADSEGMFTATGLDSGLYLLTGESQMVKDYPEAGQSSYWWPQPMYVNIKDTDVSIGVKPQTRQASRYRVVKCWQGDEEVKDEVRPEYVTVKIYYGTIEEENLRDTVELSDENDWTFEWDADKDDDPSKWHCVEVLSEDDLNNYKVIKTDNYTDGGGSIDTRIITITNKYVGPGPKPDDKNARTGDSFGLAGTLILMALALAAILILLIRRKTRNKS